MGFVMACITGDRQFRVRSVLLQLGKFGQEQSFFMILQSVGPNHPFNRET
jgi:hypothetical protein